MTKLPGFEFYKQVRVSLECVEMNDSTVEGLQVIWSVEILTVYSRKP